MFEPFFGVVVFFVYVLIITKKTVEVDP